MSNITYQCNALVGTNKTGSLKPDAQGYYRVVLGALNFYNSSGQFYPLNPEVEKLFEASSILMRRASTGTLRSEYGHPKFQPGMSKKDFLYRIMDIHETNVCCHIHKIEIDKTSVKDKQGNPIVTIIGWIKPSGPRGEVLRAQLEDPKENVCFSIRSITDDYLDASGRILKVIREIYTWDYVNEPGISIANKWASPSLEAVVDLSFTREHMVLARNMAQRMNLGMESDVASNLTRTMQTLGWDKPTPATTSSGLILPPSAKW